MAENMATLVTARQLLKTSLEKSRAFSSALDEMGPRIEKINQRLPSLEAAARSISVQKSAFSATKDHISHALGPASAVLKVFYTAHELKMSLLSDPCSDLFNYLIVMKRLEQVLRFLSDNCRLAIMWLEGIDELVEIDAAVTNEKYLAAMKNTLRILKELQANEERDLLGGGILGAALEKLAIEFKRLLTEWSVPLDLASLATFTVEQVLSTIASSSLPMPVVEKLQAIVERLSSNNKLEMCISVYVDARSSNAKRSLQTLGLDYLEMGISKFDDVRHLEGYINQWNKHLVLAVKHLFELEYRICNKVFKKIGSDVAMKCFAKIAAQSGIHAFLKFGKHVTECKKDPIKLLKLLDMFASMNNLRLDFNLLFSGENCTEIQNSTRDLVKRIVNGACEIFWQLPLQLEQQRRSSPPSDGSVPRLVSFITHYCNKLLGDDYSPILTQVLKIHQSWKQENYGDQDPISNQILVIMKEIGLNLDGWSKAYEDISLSYLFMMNNHFHLCNMKGTKLGDMMGDSWLTGHEQYTDYYAELYLKESWGKLLAILNQKGITTMAGEDSVMERLKAFNEAFDQIHKKQSNRIICNEKLREKVCELLVQAILPVYSSYIQDQMTFVEQDGAARNDVKYSVQSLEKMLSSMFKPKLSKYNSTEQRNLMGNVDYPTWKLQNMVNSLFRQKIGKHGSSRQAHLSAKIKAFAANQFRLTLIK